MSGEGASLMVEWSTPTAVALLRTLEHLKQRYDFFSGTSPASTESSPASTESSPASTESSPANTESGPASTESSPANTESGPASTESSPASTESVAAAGKSQCEQESGQLPATIAHQHVQSSVSSSTEEKSVSRVEALTPDLIQDRGCSSCAGILQELSAISLSFRFTDINAFVYGVMPGKHSSSQYIRRYDMHTISCIFQSHRH